MTLAPKKFAALTGASSLTDADIVPLSQSGNSFRTTWQAVKAFFHSAATFTGMTTFTGGASIDASGTVTGKAFTTSASTTDGGRLLRYSDVGSAAFVDAPTFIPSKTLITPVTAKVVSLDPGTAGDYHSQIVGAVHNVILTPAGTIATQTFTFPATAPIDGQEVNLISTQAITTTTFNGSTFVGAPTGFTASKWYSFVYNASDAKWYGNNA